MVGGVFQDGLASNLCSKEKKIPFLRFPFFEAGSMYDRVIICRINVVGWSIGQLISRLVCWLVFWSVYWSETNQPTNRETN
jgi:hypothetical protein